MIVWLSLFLSSVIAVDLQVINAFEKTLSDKRDNVVLGLLDYIGMPKEALSDEHMTVKVNIDYWYPEDRQHSKFNDFNYRTESFYDYISQKISFRLIIDGFKEDSPGQLPVLHHYRQYCIKMDFYSPKTQTNYSSDCLFFENRVIDVRNLTQSAYWFVEGSQMVYNPTMTAEFLHSYRRSLPPSLDYIMWCDAPKGSKEIIEPQIVFGSVKYSSTSNPFPMIKNDAAFRFLSGHLIEISDQYNFLKIYEFTNSAKYKLIRGFNFVRNCLTNDYFEYDSTSFLLLCIGNKAASTNTLTYIKIQDGDARMEFVKFNKTARNCTFGHINKFFACLVETTDNLNESQVSITYSKVEIEPLMLTPPKIVTQQEMLERWALQSHRSIEGVSLKLLNIYGCPKVCTTVVASARVRNESIVDGPKESFQTLHLDMEPNEKLGPINFYDWHQFGDIPEDSKLEKDDMIRVCGFKNNMIVFNLLTGEIAASITQDSNIKFPRQFSKKEGFDFELIDSICMNAHGFYAILVKESYTDSEGKVESKMLLLVLNGNDILNANSRLFMIEEVDNDFEKILNQFNEETGTLTIYVKRRRDNTKMISFTQRMDYPNFFINTYSAGLYNCSLEVTADRATDRLSLFSLDGIKDWANSPKFVETIPFSVKVPRWVSIQMTPKLSIHRSDRLPFQRGVYSTDPGVYDLEDVFAFSGPFYSAGIINGMITDVDKDNQMTLYPRAKLIRRFSHNIHGSDYDVFEVISPEVMVGWTAGSVDLFTMPRGVTPLTQDNIFARENEVLYNILSYEIEPNEVLAMSKMDFESTDDSVTILGGLELKRYEQSEVDNELNFVFIVYNKSKAHGIGQSLKVIKTDFKCPIAKSISATEFKVQFFKKTPSKNNIAEWYMIFSFLIGGHRELRTGFSIIHLKPEVEPGKKILELDNYRALKTFNVETMKSFYFHVQRYDLKKLDDKHFSVEILSNDDFSVSVMSVETGENTLSFTSFCLGNKGDIAESFTCSIENKLCLILYKGGSMDRVLYDVIFEKSDKVDGKTTVRVTLKVPECDAHYSIPSKYPLKEVLIGKQYIVGYNPDYEDYILVWKSNNLNEIYTSFKKYHGVFHHMRIVTGHVGDEESLLLTNGRDCGQIFHFVNLTLQIFGTDVTKQMLDSTKLHINRAAKESLYGEMECMDLPNTVPPGGKRQRYWGTVVTLVVAVIALCSVLVVANKFYYGHVADEESILGSFTLNAI